MKKIIILALTIICVVSIFAGCGEKIKKNSPSHSFEEEFEFEAGENGLTVTKYLGSSKKVVIPSVVNNKKVVYINDDVFGGNIVVEEIVLSQHMEGLYLSAFKGCDNLKSITYPGVASLADGYVLDNYVADAYYLPENLTTMIFPALKTVDVHCFSKIISRAPQVTTYICAKATELKEATSFMEECINLVVPEALVNEIKPKTVNVFAVYEYEYDYDEDAYVTKESYGDWIFDESIFQVWEEEDSNSDGVVGIIDKVEVNIGIVKSVETEITYLKDRGATDVESYYFSDDEYDGKSLTAVIRYKNSEGIECGYRIHGWYFYHDYNTDVDVAFPDAYDFCKFLKSVADPNCAVATFLGVYSITINGVTYSYEFS